MSRSNSSSQTPKLGNHQTRKSFMLVDDQLFGGKTLGVQSDVGVVLQHHVNKGGSSWCGFKLDFPLGPRNDQNGFGLCHRVNRDVPNGKIEVADTYEIEVRFPQDPTGVHPPFDKSFTQDVEVVLPTGKQKMTRFDVQLNDGVRVKVIGFNMPFANPGHPSESWLLKHRPIIGRHTLVDILEQRHFTFFVSGPYDKLVAFWAKQLPLPFKYPYGTEHEWDFERFHGQFKRIKGGQYLTAWNFDDDNEQIAATSLSQAQDGVWLYKIYQTIRQNRITELSEHARKVNAVNQLRPGSQPTNAAFFFGVAKDVAEDVILPLEVSRRMSYARALARGQGFYEETVVRPVDSGAAASVTTLPILNFLDLPDSKAHALINSFLPRDQNRVRRYMTERFLGLGLITSPLGGDNLSALCIFTLAMMQSLKGPPGYNKDRGMILSVAPTDAATDRFAACLYKDSASVTGLVNSPWRMANDGSSRDRRALIVRGYSPHREVVAFENLLRNPRLGDAADGNSGVSSWKLHLSPSYWLLAILRSRAAQLHEDDSRDLFEGQSNIDGQASLRRLRDVATEKITWAQYQAGEMVPHNRLEQMFDNILEHADVLCLTPALSEIQPFAQLKRALVKGFTIHEAGRISRADFYSVWGNTLLPCVLEGNEQQSPPVLESAGKLDKDGNHFNRFANDAAVSPLAFFQGMGLPVLQL